MKEIGKGKEFEIQRLGANVGDVVRIIKTGTGVWRRSFDPMEPHVITNVTDLGNVSFDEGEGIMYRPVVEIIKKGQGGLHEHTSDRMVSV